MREGLSLGVEDVAEPFVPDARGVEEDVWWLVEGIWVVEELDVLAVDVVIDGGSVVLMDVASEALVGVLEFRGEGILGAFIKVEGVPEPFLFDADGAGTFLDEGSEDISFHLRHPSKSMRACMQPHSITLRESQSNETGCKTRQ